MAPVRPDLAPAHPAIHLAPPVGWMNDPNGLSYVDGTWHAYYQHYPDDDVWGPMHWRHATSPDLVRWTDRGIALAPVPLGDIFSGSVVVDHDDTAGFGPGARVAVFTLAQAGDQRQGIAWSDDGHTWAMYDGNPVLDDPTQADFRDPKVIRHDDRWVMALAVGREVWLYGSDDLRRWTHLSRYRPSTPDGGQIECPDLFPLTTLSGDRAWVLLYGDDRSGPGRHPGTVAAVGSFDGTSFAELAAPSPIDAGPDFYAAQSFHGLGVDRPPVALAWMNSWCYARIHPSGGRRGVLSLPRTLHVDADLQVRSRPAPELLQAATPVPGVASWTAEPGRAAIVRGRRFTVRITGRTTAEPVRETGPPAPSVTAEAVAVAADEEEVRLVRPDNGLDIDGYALDLQAPSAGGEVLVVVDQGTVEVFTDTGHTISALCFAGTEWTVTIDGDATFALVSGS